MTLIDFIIWAVAIYLFFQVVVPLFLFLVSALVVGVASIIDAFQRRS